MTEQLGGGATTAQGVSDDVWRVIAIEGDHAAAGERRALLTAAAGVAVVVVAWSLVMVAGVLTPRLDGGTSSGGTGDAEARTSSLDFELHNQGWLTETVDGFESPLPGLEVVGAVPDRVVLGRGAVQHMKLTLHATDCTVLVPAARRSLQDHPFDGLGVAVILQRPWGEVRTTVTPPSGMADMALLACGVDPGSAGDEGDEGGPVGAGDPADPSGAAATG